MKTKVLPGGWIPIDFENLPQENVVFEWKHPEYGAIIGNIVTYQGDRNNGYKESKWIYPDPNPVSQADIWLNEFTHYRRLQPVAPISEKLPSVQPISGIDEDYHPIQNHIAGELTEKEKDTLNQGTLVIGQSESVETAADRYATKLFEYEAIKNTIAFTAFKDGTQWQLSQSKQKLTKIIQQQIEICFQCANEETDELIRNIQHGVGLALTDILTQLHNGK